VGSGVALLHVRAVVEGRGRGPRCRPRRAGGRRASSSSSQSRRAEGLVVDLAERAGGGPRRRPRRWGILVWICFDASKRDWILVADEGLGDFDCGPSSGHGVGARGRDAG
jgi:hypothetical protein